MSGVTGTAGTALVATGCASSTGSMAMLQWTAESATADVRDGVDSFVVRHGKVHAQTIWCSLTPPR